MWCHLFSLIALNTNTGKRFHCFHDAVLYLECVISVTTDWMLLYQRTGTQGFPSPEVLCWLSPSILCSCWETLQYSSRPMGHLNAAPNIKLLYPSVWTSTNNSRQGRTTPHLGEAGQWSQPSYLQIKYNRCHLLTASSYVVMEHRTHWHCDT